MKRRAYTLMELLVVTTIMVILLFVGVALVKRVMESDRTSEASRMFQAYIDRAKTAAVLNQQPAGFQMVLTTPLGHSDSTVPASTPGTVVRQVTQLFLVETPPLYAGSIQGATARIQYDPATPTIAGYFFPTYDSGGGVYAEDPTETAYLYTLIADGEEFRVRFDYKGPWFRCRRYGADFIYTGKNIMGSSVPVPPALTPGNHPGFKYQIQRGPRPVGSPLELTSGCIDLPYSGMGPDGNTSKLQDPLDPNAHTGESFYDQTNPFDWVCPKSSITILFSPTGAVKEYYVDGTGPWPCTGNLHFLIGKPAKPGFPLETIVTPGGPQDRMFLREHSNLADADSVWVTINYLTGKVTSSPNLPDASWVPAGTMTDRQAYIARCRDN